jgi:Zn-dependent protease
MPDFGNMLLFIVALAFSVSFHEFCHGWAANRLGDPTARFAGRLTMNPIAHVDPVGTLIAPGLMYILTSGGAVFGWAKPVPVNPGNLRDPRWDGLKVALIGPFSNVFLGLVCAVAFGLVARFGATENAFGDLLRQAMRVNCLLAVFNLLPVPPLDGSWILDCILPRGAYNAYQRVKPYGMLILVAIILIPGLASVMIGIPFGLLFTVLAQVANGTAGYAG